MVSEDGDATIISFQLNPDLSQNDLLRVGREMRISPPRSSATSKEPRPT